jgi:hypothetical protein
VIIRYTRSIQEKHLDKRKHFVNIKWMYIKKKSFNKKWLQEKGSAAGGGREELIAK